MQVQTSTVNTLYRISIDIGGALGLILGLNVLDVFVFSGSLLKIIWNFTFSHCTKARRKRLDENLPKVSSEKNLINEQNQRKENIIESLRKSVNSFRT